MANQPAENNQPEKVPITFIKCQCGNNVFIKGSILGPGEKTPNVLQKVWICVGCGMRFAPDEFPSKGEEESRRESKILLPDRKLTVIN